ncbi:MAG: MBL fold metallo-hydrolase [Pseudomonadota bacterium]
MGAILYRRRPAAFAFRPQFAWNHEHGRLKVCGCGVSAPFDADGEDQIVLGVDGLRITAFAVDHAPVTPAVGYRFDYKGRSLCISGDTLRSSNLERVCDGVDVLVHEALQPALVGKMEAILRARGNENAAKIMADIVDYHASPEDAAESARTTKAKMLVLSHLVPPLPSKILYPAFLGGAAERYGGPIVVGEDGMLFSLPAASHDIERKNLL